MNDLVPVIFIFDVVLRYILLIGAAWSVALPARRIWPPPGRRSWQYRLTWACFYLVFPLNALLVMLNWNTWLFTEPSRLVLGIPVAAKGALLVAWGALTLGLRNTSGLRDGFVQSGPYRFTRNPQYLGDIVLFLGLSLAANSWVVWIVHGLLSLVFVIAPLAEETWLEEQYGDTYQDYKRRVSRFL